MAYQKNTEEDVTNAVRTTKEALLEVMTKKEVDEIDFSYITKELLDEYDLYAKEKDQSKCKAQLDNSKNSWCYWGNKPVVKFPSGKKVLYYYNNNSSTGCDTSSNKCYDGNYWKVEVTSYQFNPKPSCPSGTPGHNKQTIRAK